MLNLKSNNWLFINHKCPVCELNPRGPLGLCDPCHSDLPILINACPFCAMPRDLGSDYCNTCQNQTQIYDRAWAPFQYGFPFNAIFAQVKQGKHPNALHWMARVLADAAPTLTNARAWTLIPSPMHPLDRLKRGFNQTEILAAPLAKMKGLNLDKQLIRKTKRTPHQAALNREQRLTNLQGSFTLADTPPERVILIDDVITTGATGQALAGFLKQAGCKEVWLWALCRTL